MEYRHIRLLKQHARCKADGMLNFAERIESQNLFFEAYEELISILCLLENIDYIEEVNPDMFEIKKEYFLLRKPLDLRPGKYREYLMGATSFASGIRKFVHKSYPAPGTDREI